MNMVYDVEEFSLESSAPLCEPPPHVSVPPKKVIHPYWRSLGNRVLISCILCVLILTMHLWWANGEAFLKEHLCASEIGTTEAAAQVFVKSVMSGEPVPEALAVFFQEVTDAQN